MAKSATEGIWQHGSALGKTADQFSDGRLSEWGETMKAHLPDWLGGRAGGSGHGGDENYNYAN